MKRHGFWQLGLIFSIIFIMFIMPFAAAAEPMVVKMAHVWPATSWPGETIIMFGDGVEKSNYGSFWAFV